MIRKIKILCLLVLPGAAFAEPSPQSCANDPKSRIFEEYESLTNEAISRRCTYDIEKHEPDADDSKIKVNNGRTSNCEKGLFKMREISRRYVAKKKDVCLKARSAPTCAETSSQTSCVLDAAKLAAQVKRGEEELRAIMLEGKEKLSSVSRFNRLLTSQFMKQRRELGRLPSREKIQNLPWTKDAGGRSNLTSRVGRGGTKVSALEARPSPEAPVSTISHSSGARPGAYEPSSNIRPQDYGLKTLAEYERKLPLLIEQNESVTKQLREFEETRAVKRSEHKVAASEMAAKATQFFATAEKMGYAGEEITEWKKENAEAPPPAVAGVPVPPAPQGQELERYEREPVVLLAAPQAKEKDKPAVEVNTAPTAAPANAPISEEEPALSSFPTKLSDESKNPGMIAERTRLRDILRRRAQNPGAAAAEEKVPGELVGDILAEAKAVLHRPLDSGGTPEGMGTLDVASALEDMEGQLRELDRAAGVLEAESLSLFDRVKLQLRRRWKSWDK